MVKFHNRILSYIIKYSNYFEKIIQFFIFNYFLLSHADLLLTLKRKDQGCSIAIELWSKRLACYRCSWRQLGFENSHKAYFSYHLVLWSSRKQAKYIFILYLSWLQKLWRLFPNIWGTSPCHEFSLLFSFSSMWWRA